MVSIRVIQIKGRVSSDRQDRNFVDRVSEVEHGARPLKREIEKHPRIGPVVLALDHIGVRV